MGLFSKRKAKKEAKKAEEAAKVAATKGKAAAQAAAVPVGEIHIKQSSTNLAGGGGSGGSGAVRGGGGYKRKAKYSNNVNSPSGKSHVSVVSALSKDTAFPETPKRWLFKPEPAPLLPSMHGDDEEGSGDLLRVSGRSGRGWTGEQAAAKIDTKAAATVPKSTAAASSTKTETSDKKKKTGSMWTRSKHFQALTDWAFKTIDADGSGQVDKKELYTGLLMIHLKLATYAGPAACRPATREYCEKIFDQMDVDHSGELDREEFTEVMKIVCASVFTRVCIQWTFTLMIVPMIAQGIIKVLSAMNDTAWGFWMEIDELDPMRATCSNMFNSVWDKILSVTPNFVQTALGMTVGKLDDLWAKVPEGVKETLPVTLMSCILSCLMVPYLIYKMDEYHEHRAEKKGKELKKELDIQAFAKK